MNLVDSLDQARVFLNWIDDQCNSKVTLAIDTETRGLRWWDYAFTRLVQFGTPQGGWAVPTEWFGKVTHEAMAKLVTARKPIVFHNAKFDMHALEVMGCQVPTWFNVHDTAFLLSLDRSNMGQALKGKNTARLLGPGIYQGQAWLGQRARELGMTPSNKWELMPVDEPAYWAYGIVDTCLTADLFDALSHHHHTEQYMRERTYSAIMYRVEKRGMRIDVDYTRQLGRRFDLAAEQALHFLQSQGINNPNANNQVIAILEKEHGWVPTEFTDKGNVQLDKKVLASLANGGMAPDVIEALVTYRQSQKWKAAYCDKFLEGLDVFGVVHPSIKTMYARTGRSSIDGIAVQTLPSNGRAVRRCILPPEGTDWYSADYSNQEPRALAHFGRSKPLIELFTKGGHASVHDFVAENLFGAGYDKPQRSIAKTFGLGRSYGAGVDELASQSGLHPDVVARHLPVYDELMGLTALNRMIARDTADRDPAYVVTSGGRRVYADEGKNYTLTNYLMQGSGADMLKDAVIRLDQEDLSDYIIVPVHDEVCFGFPKGDEGTVMAQVAARLMEDDSYIVPMPVDVEGPGDSWGALYPEEEA